MQGAFKNLALVTQLALSIVTPCILTIALCYWLRGKFGLGDWIMVVGILWGLASGFVSAWKYLKKAVEDAEKRQEEYDNRFR